METPIKIDDLGVFSLFLETPICHVFDTFDTTVLHGITMALNSHVYESSYVIGLVSNSM